MLVKLDPRQKKKNWSTRADALKNVIIIIIIIKKKTRVNRNQLNHRVVRFSCGFFIFFFSTARDTSAQQMGESRIESLSRRRSPLTRVLRYFLCEYKYTYMYWNSHRTICLITHSEHFHYIIFIYIYIWHSDNFDQRWFDSAGSSLSFSISVCILFRLYF